MITKKAFAKINLGLRILDERKDGYHNIETIFHRVNIYDSLRFEAASDISLVTTDSRLPTDLSNLCVRAAFQLREKFNVTKGVKISLEKQIPVGAGLGGGSSDAATTLLALCELWNLSPAKQQLEECALKLGSDVPYFLNEGSAYATGRGELLEYFHIEIPYWILVVYPNVHVATSWAYKQLKENRQKGNHPLPSFLAKERIPKLFAKESGRGEVDFRKVIVNDFEEIVFHEYPLIKSVKARLLEGGASFAQMSGSGSSVYGFFNSEEKALSVMGSFDMTHTVFITSPDFQPQETSPVKKNDKQ